MVEVLVAEVLVKPRPADIRAVRMLSVYAFLPNFPRMWMPSFCLTDGEPKISYSEYS